MSATETLRIFVDTVTGGSEAGLKRLESGAGGLGGAFERLGNTMSSWGVPFSGTVTKMGKDLEDAKSHGQGFSKAMSDAGGILTGVLAVGAGAVAVESIHMADQFEASHARLSTALHNTGSSMQAAQGSVDSFDGKMTQLGYSQTKTEDALSRGVIATGNLSQAEREVSVAADLAAAKHIDLNSAMQLVIKAAEGNTGALRRQGIDLPIVSSNAEKVKTSYEALGKAEENLTQVQQEVADGQIKAAAAPKALEAAVTKVGDAQQKYNDLANAGKETLDALAQREQGQASAAADTLQGRVHVLGAEMENAGISIGTWLIPKLEAAGAVLSDVVGWFEQGSTGAHAVEIAVAGVGAALIGAFVVNKVEAGIQSIQRAWSVLTGSAGEDAAATDAAAQSQTSLTAALEANTTAIAENTTALGGNAEAAGAAGEAHAAAVPEVEASTAAMGEGELAAGGLAGGLGGLIGPLAIAGVGLAAVGLGLHSLIGGMDTSKIQNAVNAFNAFDHSLNPGQILAAAGTLDRLAGSTDYYTKAAERSANYQQALRIQSAALADTQLNLKQTQDQVGEALQSLTNLQTSGTASAVDLQSAQDNVTASLHQVIAAAKQNADVMTAGQSTGQRQVAENSAEYASLQQLAQQYPALGGQIEGYIAQLGLIPPSKNTTATFDDRAALAEADNYSKAIRNLPTGPDPGKGVGSYQTGGLVPGSGPQLAIVHGGEIVYNPAEPSGGLAALAAAGAVPDLDQFGAGFGRGAGGGAGLGGDLMVAFTIQLDSGDLIDLIHQGLLRKQIRTPLGIKAG